MLKKARVDIYETNKKNPTPCYQLAIMDSADGQLSQNGRIIASIISLSAVFYSFYLPIWVKIRFPQCPVSESPIFNPRHFFFCTFRMSTVQIKSRDIIRVMFCGYFSPLVYISDQSTLFYDDVFPQSLVSFCSQFCCGIVYLTTGHFLYVSDTFPELLFQFEDFSWHQHDWIYS